MKSKSIFKKLAMFVVILALVMSVAGTAFASPGGGGPGGGGPGGGGPGGGNPPAKPDTVTVVYNLNGGGESFSETVAVTDKDTHHPKATVSLPVVTRAGYDLTGWSLGAAGTSVDVNVSYNQGSHKWNDINVKAEWIEVRETSLYNVNYTGTYADGAIFWPDNVVNATTPPTIAGNPYRAGYYFSGWMPSTLDWSKADKIVVDKVITHRCNPSYIERTITYTINVFGTFSLEPVIPVVPQEVPIAAPQTGSTPYIAYAVVLAVLAAATAGFALIRKRDS